MFKWIFKREGLVAALRWFFKYNLPHKLDLKWFWFKAYLRGEKPSEGYCGLIMADEPEWNPESSPEKYIARRKKLAICVRNLSH